MKNYKEMNRVEKLVWSDAKDSENPETYLEEVCQHGCVSGMVSRLIYYKDTIAFYKKYRKEIAAMVRDLIESTGEPIDSLFRDFDGEDPFAQETHNRNLLAWALYEEAARNILEG